MLKDDRNVLAAMVREYSIGEVVRALVEVTLAEADQLSDNGLKQQAIAMCESGYILQRAADEIHNN
jgi:DNA-binding IscR family transcriptional regulator